MFVCRKVPSQWMSNGSGRDRGTGRMGIAICHGPMRRPRTMPDGFHPEPRAYYQRKRQTGLMPWWPTVRWPTSWPGPLIMLMRDQVLLTQKSYSDKGWLERGTTDSVGENPRHLIGHRSSPTLPGHQRLDRPRREPREVGSEPSVLSKHPMDTAWNRRFSGSRETGQGSQRRRERRISVGLDPDG